LPLSFDKLRMVSLAEPFFKEGYKGTFVLLEPITEGLQICSPALDGRGLGGG
jgi:hypothetical protein